MIFGATGGVMEAALRTAYEVITKKELRSLDFEAVRGMDGIKQATVDVDGLKLKVAVAHGLSNAKVLMDRVRSGERRLPLHRDHVLPGRVPGRRRPAGADERRDTEASGRRRYTRKT